MSFNVFLLFGGIIASLVFIYPAKELKSSIYPIAVSAIAVIITAHTLRSSAPVFRYLEGFIDSDYSAYFKVLIKVLGITLASNMTSDIAAELGSVSLSGKVEFAGKMAIILSALPLLDSVLSRTVGLL